MTGVDRQGDTPGTSAAKARKREDDMMAGSDRQWAQEIGITDGFQRDSDRQAIYSGGLSSGAAGPRSADSNPSQEGNGRGNRSARPEEQSSGTAPDCPGNRPRAGASTLRWDYRHESLTPHPKAARR
jgi:hypothetical protein